MRWTFFVASAIGYIDYPEALFTRSLANALADREIDVRIVEPRQNELYVKTLEIERSEAARAMFDLFPNVQHHTFEMRRGPRLFEWLAREIALIDVAVAVDGVDAELVRWLANLNQPRLVRVFQAYRPATLTLERSIELELGLFSGTIAPSEPAVGGAWQRVRPSLAPADLDAGRLRFVDESLRAQLVSPSQACDEMQAAVDSLQSTLGATLPPRT